MSMLSRTAMFGTAGLLLAVLPAGAKPKAMPKTAFLQTAVIKNTGSTNTFGYKITATATKGTYQISSVSNGGKDISNESGMPSGVQPLVAHLFTDLNAAMPLTSLPVRYGMRSASFGTRTTITYKGQTSPDLTFASDPRTAALKADIDALTKTLGIGNAPKHLIVIKESTKPWSDQHFLERF